MRFSHLMWNLRGIVRDDGAGDVEDLLRCILCIGAGSRLLGLIKLMAELPGRTCGLAIAVPLFVQVYKCMIVFMMDVT
jgi:hypothetical protein